MKFSVTKLILLTLASQVCFMEATLSADRAERVFSSLKQLPYTTNSFPQVKKFVKILIKLHPSRSYKYFKMGYLRISEDTALVKKLKNDSIKAVFHSSLSDSQKHKIIKQINNETL